MRTFSFWEIATLALLSFGFQADAAKPVTSSPFASDSPSVLLVKSGPSAVRQYLVECELTRTNSTFLNRKKIVSSSRIAITEDRVAKLESLQQTPFVTSVEIIKGTLADANQPIITVFDEGHTVEVKITAVDDLHIQLDARLSILKIEIVGTDTIGESTTQAPIHNSITQRVVRTVKLGETFRQKIPAFGKEKPMVFEYTVTEVKASEKNRFKVETGRTVAKVKP